MIIGAILCSICICVLAVLSAVHGFAYNSSTSVLQKEMPSANTGKSGNPLFLIFDANEPTIAFLIVMYISVAVYSCTWGPLGWVYPAELYSQGVRAKALGISTASNWLFTYAVLQLTPIMLQRIYWRTYVLFSVMCFIIALIVYWYYPETNVNTSKNLFIFDAKN